MIDWVVLVPIKRFADAKTRLHPRADRAAVAEAIARDTLDAVAGVARVRMILVMTDDPALVEDLGLPVAVTVRTQRVPGLNNAIADGLRYAQESWPEYGQAVLLGDLPALTSEDLEDTLAAAEELPLGVVPDATGSGTVMITAEPGVPLIPAFGVGSARRHRELGHRMLRAPEGLRRDVDTPEDLQAAIRLGVGRHTSALLGLAPSQRSSVRQTA
ncbi:MAG TPA: 2-phospho-L-lactate guanylyltransferase [Amnibacterium sp.]|uniref:2-phospho-L-lactate guanylyltransferase n=1 Tax=Amnibacterium sp. TaxID=1872496 RepID=UPI002F939483